LKIGGRDGLAEGLIGDRTYNHIIEDYIFLRSLALQCKNYL